MSYSILVRVASASFAALALCISPALGDPKPLSKEEQTRIDRAIDRAVSGLKHVQTKNGDWPRQYAFTHLIGQCALPAYALLESGVPTDDPVIQNAADYLRARVLTNEKTYELSLALLFFDRLGEPKDKPLIRSLGLRLIAGQHLTGGWNYRCPVVPKEMEDTLFKTLQTLDKKQEGGEKWPIKGLRVPAKLRTLTVFRDPRLLPWQDAPESDENKQFARIVGTTDNSNTQFAMLGLWAAQRHDLPIGPTFRLMVERFERTQSADGWWPYLFDRSPVASRHPRPSMICVGLLSLATGSGIKSPMLDRTHADNRQQLVLKGLVALSEDISVAASGRDGVGTLAWRGPYYLWSVERVAMLYNLQTIEDKDWYRWGAGILVASQRPGGEWRLLSLSPKSPPMPYYGPIINTSLALLFLKRSHPMKDLTPKLPSTGKGLNASIVRLRLQGMPDSQKTTTSSDNHKSNR